MYAIRSYYGWPSLRVKSLIKSFFDIGSVQKCYVITSYSIHYTKLYDGNEAYNATRRSIEA